MRFTFNVLHSAATTAKTKAKHIIVARSAHTTFFRLLTFISTHYYYTLRFHRLDICTVSVYFFWLDFFLLRLLFTSRLFIFTWLHIHFHVIIMIFAMDDQIIIMPLLFTHCILISISMSCGILFLFFPQFSVTYFYPISDSS